MWFLRLSVYLPVFFLTACSVSPSENSCLVRGYNTHCQGRVRFQGNSPNEFASIIELPAGDQQLSVIAESEPEPSEQYPSDGDYNCSNISRHTVSFTCKPGNTYRAWLSPLGGKDYSVEILEQLPDDPVSTTNAHAASKQEEVRTRCGYFASDC